MADYICTEKIYNDKSKLIGYKIKNEHGQEKSIDTGTLKNAIRTGQITVRNLELTDSNRLKYKPYVKYLVREYIITDTKFIEGTRHLALVDGKYQYVGEPSRIEKTYKLIREIELRPGESYKYYDNMERNPYVYRLAIIEADKQTEIDINNSEIFYDLRSPRSLKQNYKKFEKIRNHFWDGHFYGTPYTCRLWIDKKISINCLTTYEGPILYQITDMEVVYNDGENEEKP